MLRHVAQQVVRFHIVVAGVQVTIVLHGQGRAAALLENAETGTVAGPGGERHIEDLDEYPAHVAAHPLLEDGNQEVAVLPIGDAAVRDPVAFLVAGLVVPFHNRNELHEIRPDFVSQVAIHLQRMMIVAGVHGTQDVEFNFVLPEQSRRAHHPGMGRCTALVDAVLVVQFRRPVHAEAHQEVVGCEELAPFVVQEGAVGLQGVLDAHARTLVLLLQSHGLPKPVESHQGWLAALPGKGDLRDLLGLDVLTGVLLEQVQRHAEVRSGIEILLGQEIAIGAVQVADRAARLEHDVEGVGRPSRRQGRCAGQRYLKHVCHPWSRFRSPEPTPIQQYLRVSHDGQSG